MRLYILDETLIILLQSNKINIKKLLLFVLKLNHYMKNKVKLLLLLLSTCFIFQNCEDVNDNPSAENTSINSFVWNGLNTYYLWQADVPNLSDSYLDDQKKLNSLLSGYSSPEDLFQNLLYKPASMFPAGQAVDRFSVIFSDYTLLEGVLSGNTLNNGVDFGLKRKSSTSNDVFGWVRYIIANSDASTKDIHRGDLFYAVNGTPLTLSNYQSLIYGADNTYTLNLADYNNGNITPNGRSVSLTKTNLSENPVLMTTVINSGNHKVGYLVYNGFYANYESQLNAAFGELKSQGVTQLVLDLRYNSGGSVDTATRLGSMITGQFNGEVFGKQQWNTKVDDYYKAIDPTRFFNYFTNTLGNNEGINSLNLSKVYVLTSLSTASASELVINALKPYINVVQIGDKTTGKNVGSITLYDSPTFDKKDLNPNHKYAMQPLVLKIVNKEGFGDYTNGLQPTITLKEDLGNLGVLGNPSEPLLSTALNAISTSGKKKIEDPSHIFEDVIDTQSINRFEREMYIENVPFVK